MENVKTFAANIKLENDSLIVEQGAILGNSSVEFGGKLSAYGTLADVTVKNFGYIGVGVNGRANFVGVEANGRFDVWANAQAVNTRVSGFDAANTGNMYVLDGAVARDTDVDANGALHITGKAYDTDVNFGGYVGVGANGVADDIDINFGGNVVVFDGGTVVDAEVWGGGVMTLWSGATAVDTQINGGEVRLAGGAYMIGDVEVNNGDLVFFASASRFGEGEITVSTGGAITTWGDNCFCGPVIFEMEDADVLDKVRVDNIGAIGDSCIEVEVDSGLDAGRYLMAGNAEFLKGCNILVRDDYNSESIIQIGECGFYANNRTYCFNVDANNNLYMDVIDGIVQVDCSNQSTNSLGTGDFGAAGEQIVWINEDKSFIGIANVGTFATAGEFAGIGDFDGNGIDDILFANGNDLNAIFNYAGAPSGTVNYKDALAGGTVDDFQIADQGGYDTVFVKYADVFSEAVLFNFAADQKDWEYKFTALQNYETCIK